MHPAIELTVLCDNQAGAGLEAEHGLAIWIRTPTTTLLFDTGCGSTLDGNAAALGVSLADCDTLVLSHGHYDHTGGLPTLLAANHRCRILAHPAALRERYSRHPDKGPRSIGMPEQIRDSLAALAPGRLHLTTAPWLFTSSMGTSGEIPRPCPFEDVGGPFFLDPCGEQADDLSDDCSLWFHTRQGLVIVLGCCHSGVVNTVTRIRTLTGIQAVHGLIGGLHLLHATAERLEKTAAFLAECRPDFLALGHCSGDAAVDMLKATLRETDVYRTWAGLHLSWQGICGL